MIDEYGIPCHNSQKYKSSIEIPDGFNGMALRDQRLNRDMSQTELAIRLDTDQSLISVWETGKRKPQYASIRKICSVFHCRWEDLTGL